MTENAKLLGQDDVIKVNEQYKSFMPHTVFTTNDFISKLTSLINYNSFQEWMKNAMEADVLVSGKSWQKGKLVLRMEFIPDETPIESLLDEFRNKPNN